MRKAVLPWLPPRPSGSDGGRGSRWARGDLRRCWWTPEGEARIDGRVELDFGTEGVYPGTGCCKLNVCYNMFG